ncbi:MAG: WYL domain-containing protein, partial [Prochlorotrichaceae cyanobacterium]
PMPRKRSSINLSVSDHEKQALETLASKFQIYWGDKPNVSELIKRIAQGKFRVVLNDDWSDDRIETLNRIQGLLKDRGNVEEAVAIAELLLERSELITPLRKELNAFVAKPAPAWRLTIEKLRYRMQPFRLTYQDAADRLLEFHIYYAEFKQHDDREYLDCWCAETEGNKDLPALNHNWCLRLDRIPEETAITEIQGHWRPLDVIEVEFHLLNNLAFAYRTKNNVEEVNQWHPDREKVRQVIRKVTNTFWLLREIRRYGSDCVVVSPPELRDRIQQDYRESLKLYGMTTEP